MSAVALDSSVLVPAFLPPHVKHEVCWSALNAALSDEAVVPQAALAETYAVLTRLPSPLRLRPHDAAAILERTLKGAARVVSLSPSATWRLLAECGSSGLGGGAIYDRRILAEARAGGASRMLTLNPRDFLRGDTHGVEIIDPSAA